MMEYRQIASFIPNLKTNIKWKTGALVFILATEITPWAEIYLSINVFSRIH